MAMKISPANFSIFVNLASKLTKSPTAIKHFLSVAAAKPLLVSRLLAIVFQAFFFCMEKLNSLFLQQGSLLVFQFTLLSIPATKENVCKISPNWRRKCWTKTGGNSGLRSGGLTLEEEVLD